MLHCVGCMFHMLHVMSHILPSSACHALCASCSMSRWAISTLLHRPPDQATVTTIPTVSDSHALHRTEQLCSKVASALQCPASDAECRGCKAP